MASQTQALNQLSKDQIQQFKSIFNLIDQDHDDNISVKDLKTTICNMGVEDIDDNTIAQMIPENQQKTGINFSVFLKLMSSKYGEFTEKTDLTQAFSVFKTTTSGDDDGLNCNSDELKESLLNTNARNSSKMNDSSIEKIINNFSKTNDLSGESVFNAESFIDTVKN
ncbi:hypothetical protein CANARDRAFT_24791 [[Candida] arabinofermentans NRRL YB-2248]|uniref:EF-hand domain-containing protein n=1 Tax=[Candida] arabinofermentans NRRL YB-2248 TaxID=983967 RepID=A0A1E4SVL7_9ASCO|nr:hypothetical protein CANARDRAFT_24791 [[Candida] arabinofermentans NRRL YB-2248]